MTNPAKKKLPAKSMVYYVLFEHTLNGQRIKGSDYIQLTGKVKITEPGDIIGFHNVLRGKEKFDPLVTDWKELGLMDTIPATQK